MVQQTHATGCPGLNVNALALGGLGAFQYDVDHFVEDLDAWAINTVGRSGLTRRDSVYEGTEKCHKPGGVLPVDEP